MKLGTRGSRLAMAQAHSVAAMLQPILGPVEIVTIRTSGDAGNRERLGAFVSEIEEAIAAGHVDIGLHCLKDIPTRPRPGLNLAAHLEREDPRDALLTRGHTFAELKEGALIGTGSLRRTSQLAGHGRQFGFKPLVGNVDTRLSKLQQGEYDAIVLAIAGLKRLGILETWSESPYADITVEPLDAVTMVPAPGQATLVLQMREGDPHTEAVATLNHRSTEICSIAERTFMATFGGGCSVPVGAYAMSEEDHFLLHGLVASPDGKVSYRGSRAFGSEQAEYFGRELAEEVGSQGGFEIVNAVVKGGGK